jgi:hypothetical protein
MSAIIKAVGNVAIGLAAVSSAMVTMAWLFFLPSVGALWLLGWLK